MREEKAIHILNSYINQLLCAPSHPIKNEESRHLRAAAIRLFLIIYSVYNGSISKTTFQMQSYSFSFVFPQLSCWRLYFCAFLNRYISLLHQYHSTKTIVHLYFCALFLTIWDAVCCINKNCLLDILSCTESCIAELILPQKCRNKSKNQSLPQC